MSLIYRNPKRFQGVEQTSIDPLYLGQSGPPTGHAEITEMGWKVAPEKICNILMQFAIYPVKELIVTENGAAFPDHLIDGRVHDQQRINYYKRYQYNVLRAKNDRAHVKGYFVWNFIDSFEWDEGFRPRSGIVHNDHHTQKRKVNDSGLWFREFSE